MIDQGSDDALGESRGKECERAREGAYAEFLVIFKNRSVTMLGERSSHSIDFRKITITAITHTFISHLSYITPKPIEFLLIEKESKTCSPIQDDSSSVRVQANTGLLLRVPDRI